MKDDWIDIKDELPPEGEWVFFRHFLNWVLIGSFYHDTAFGEDHFIDLFYCAFTEDMNFFKPASGFPLSAATHWKPLPKQVNYRTEENVDNGRTLLSIMNLIK